VKKRARLADALSIAYKPRFLLMFGEGEKAALLTLREQLINALCIAGYNTFMAALGFGAAGILSDLRIASLGLFLTFGASFFGYLVTVRGLKTSTA